MNQHAAHFSRLHHTGVTDVMNAKRCVIATRNDCEQNLITLCSACHTTVHYALGVSAKELLQRIEKSEIGAEILFRIARRSGRTVEWSPTGKDSV
jgi:hypothetical protein